MTPEKLGNAIAIWVMALMIIISGAGVIKLILWLFL